MLSFPAAVAALTDALATPGAAAVFTAPPGTGKTTRVPLALLESDWLAPDQSILMLEPRRLAARAAAERMAALYCQSVGDAIGYRVRFDTRVGPQTRIEVMTEGTLVRRLQNDPELSGVGVVIFDEIHERHLQTDLALALTLDARAGLRDDLRLVAMSATLMADRTADMLGRARTIEAEGVPYPVTTEYVGGGLDNLLPTIRRAARESSGDVLVFLPGAREIRAAAAALADDSHFAVHTLYGEMAWSDQERALRADPGGLRKVVLATNIAESSLTIEGVATVVDTGLARIPRYDPNAALTRLTTERISQASADQRRGRAGRLGPGRCYRLWTESEHASRARFQTPEVQHADLARLLLEILVWGSTPGSLSFHEPLPGGAVEQAAALLRGLGASDEQGRVTPLGRRLAQLPLHPRLAAMIESAPDPGARALACRLGAIVEEGSPWRGPVASRPIDIVEVARLVGRSGRAMPEHAGNRLSHGVLNRIRRAETALRRSTRVDTPCPDATAYACARIVLPAFPDRVANARSGGERGNYAMSNGRAVSTEETDLLAGEPWLVVLDAADYRKTARAHLAVSTSEDQVREVLAPLIESIRDVAWDRRQERVRAEQVLQIGRLPLSREALRDVSNDEVEPLMLTGIRSLGLEVLPWTDTARQWRARVTLLSGTDQSRAWPAVDDQSLLQTLEQWLQPFLRGASRRDQLAAIPLMDALQSLLPWDLQRELERLAPRQLEVPSGRKVPIQYQVDGRPVLEVQLQEMLGTSATPTVADGRVPLQIHLLSPANRPIQVTTDLAGFWQSSYAEVRKEMRGRYPKHAWPEDPQSATAHRGARHRRK